MNSHLHHFVCCRCRRSVKADPQCTAGTFQGIGCYFVNPVHCSVCQGEMAPVGKLFAAPRRCDDLGWKKVEWMVSNGWRGYGWPTQPRMLLREVRAVVPVLSPVQKRMALVKQERDAAKRFKSRQRRQHGKVKREKRDLKAQCKYQGQVLARLEEATEQSKG